MDARPEAPTAPEPIEALTGPEASPGEQEQLLPKSPLEPDQPASGEAAPALSEAALALAEGEVGLAEVAPEVSGPVVVLESPGEASEAAEEAEEPAEDLVDGAASAQSEAELAADPVERACARARSETWVERIALYERQLLEETSRARAALLEHEIGDQLERLARDEAGAIKAYARSLSSDPMLRPNLWAVRRIFYRRKLWPSLLKLLDAEIRYASTDAERAELWSERGHILEDCLHDTEEAIRCFQAAHRLDPHALAPLAALERIYARTQDEVSLIEIYRALAAATQEPGRRVALLFDLARIEEAQATALGVLDSEAAADEGGTPLDRALSYLHSAYEVGVDQLRVVDEIIRITSTHGRIAECLAALDVKAELLELQAEQASPQRRRALADEVVAVRRWQAAMARTKLGDLELVWQYLQLGNLHSPGDPLILHDLIEVASATGRWNDLEGLLGLLVERRRQGRPERPPLGLLLWRAQALRLAGRDAEAEDLEHQVRLAAPLHLPFLVQRERRALRRQELNALGTLYREEADIARRGLLLREGEPPRPDLLWAAGALLRAGSCYLRAGEYGPALGALEEAQQVARQAQAAAEAAGSLAAAQTQVQARLIVDALERVYERTERWDALVALYERELEARPEGLRAERLHEALCELYAERLGDLERARAHNDALLRLHPEDLRLHLRGVELRRRLGDGRAEAEALRALDQVEARLSPGGRWVEAILRRAELLIEAQDEAQAMALYEEVLRHRPGEPRVLDALERLLRRARRFEQLEQLLRRQADACSAAGPELAGRLLALQVELAELYERELGSLEAAASVYRDVLIRRPGYLPALYALGRVYRRAVEEGGDRAGAAVRLASLLELLAEAVPPGQARSDALLQLAEVYEELLARPAEAADACQRALGALGGAAPEEGTLAHAALGRLRALSLLRATAELPGVMAALETGLPTPVRALLAEEQAALGLQAGGAPAELLRRAEGELRAFYPEGPPLAELGLWRLACRNHDGKQLGAALAEVAARCVDGEGEDAVLSGLWLRAGLLGDLHHEEPAERSQTWERLLQAWRLQPGSRAVLAALGDALLGTPPEEWPPEAAAILRLLRQQGAGTDPRHRLMLALAEAEAHLAAAAAAPGTEAAADALQQAATAALEALEIDPHSVLALWLLRRATAPAQGASPEALRCYALYTLRLAEELREPSVRAALYQEAADHLLACGDRDGAAAALRAVLDVRPSDPVAFGQAYELLMARAQPVESGGQGDPSALLELLDARLAYHAEDEALRATEVPLRVALLLQRAALRQAAGDDDEAAADLRALLALEPRHLVAQRRLADLLVQSGSIEEALAEYERLLELDLPPEDRRAVNIQMATLLSETDPARASFYLGRAIALGPEQLSPAQWAEGSEAALYHWQVRLLLQAGEPAEAVSVLRGLAALIPPGPDQDIQRARVELEIADVLYQHAGDPTGALLAVERALSSDPLSLEALDRMVSLCTELGELSRQTKQLYHALNEARNQAAAQRPEAITSEPYHALAQIYSWLGRPDGHYLAVQAECAVNGTPSRIERPHRLPRKPLTPVLSVRTFSDAVQGVPLQVWREVWESMSRLLGPDLAQLAAHPKDRLNAKAVPPEWAPLEEMTRLFGLGPQVPYGLYLAREPETCAVTGMSLVCGSAFATSPASLPPRLYVRLVIRLALLPDRLGCVYTVSPDELLVAMAAACRLVEQRGPEVPSALAARVEEQMRALSRVMTRRERKALAALTPRMDALNGSFGRSRILEWQHELRLGVARLAMALSGNVTATLDELAVGVRDPAPDSARTAQALLRFAISSEIQDLRYELGIHEEEGQRAAG
ncbi:MAG: hypothetical protein NZ890_00085 [Myxococcota bacterium]|nr:hypothetical protein [Myxococcota bacterium]